MSLPSDLVAHYSTKAFHTRLAALSFVGAVLGADVVWKNEIIRSHILGIGLLLVVGSLAELNRRYTYSFLCACIASALSDVPVQMWDGFTKMNEKPWSSKALEKSSKPSEGSKNFVSRFLLSWGTYLPGISAGLYLGWYRFSWQELNTTRVLWGVAVTLLAVGLMSWWGLQTARTYNPKRLLAQLDENPGSEKQVAGRE